MRRMFVLGAALLLIPPVACGDGDGDGQGQSTAPATRDVAEIEVSSEAFTDGGEIPAEYTCEGEDRPLSLQWSVPADVSGASFVLIMDDPDAGGFVHWIVYDVPGDVTALDDAPQGTGTLQSGAKQGENTFGEVGYGGPCPPQGEEHTYRIRVFLVDMKTGVDPGAAAVDVTSAIQGHITGFGELRGTFAR